MFIYGLCDPITSEIRYVGFTSKSLMERLATHLRPSSLKRNSYKDKWIKGLLSNNLKPEIFKIQETDENNWVFDEQWNIEYFNYIGCRLTNTTIGGEGIIGYKYSEEDKIRISERQKGKNAYWFGKNLSESTKQKLSLSKSGENAPWFGKHLTEETKLKMSIRRKGKIKTVQHLKNISESKCILKKQQREDVINKYYIDKLNYKQIADFYNVGIHVIFRIIKKYKVGETKEKYNG